MSVSQTSMSSIQKVQQKPNAANKDAPELNMGNGFSSLFAEAMQGRGMSQQFASSELELQNGLGKNDQTPASPPADLSGLNGVASAVQSAIAAQREGASANTQSMGSQVSNAATSANNAQNNTAPANNPQANKAVGNDKPQQPNAEVKPTNDANTQTNTQQEATATDSAQTTLATNSQASTEQAAQAKTGPLPTQTADGKALANEVTKLDAATEAKLAAEMKANESASDTVALDQTTDKATPKATEATNTTTKADLKADTKADTKVDAKPDEKLEVNTRANTRDEAPRTETKTEQRVEAKADTRADQRVQDRPLPNARADMAAAMVDTRAQQAAATGKLQAGDVKLTTGVTGTQSADGQPGLMGLAGVANSKQAGQATEATIKTPITQPGFAKELGQKLTWAIGKNLSTVDLRVNPEQFGSMNIRLLQKGDQVQLVIRTADDATGALLQQAVSGLKEAMGQQGLQLTNVQIQTSQNQLGANAQFGQQANQGQQGGQSNNQGQPGNGQGGNTGNGGNQTAENETTQPARRNPNGNLDLFA